MKRWGWVVGLLVGSLSTSVGERQAEACGGFFSQNAKQVPSLQVEQVLLLHDAEAGQQHFIRQIVFRDAAERFGFVVPVPALPQVSTVKGNPFPKLHSEFPAMMPPRVTHGSGDAAGEGFGAGRRAGGGVRVLSTERIGSFTAFIVEAKEPEAMQRWLTENQLATTPASETS